MEITKGGTDKSNKVLLCDVSRNVKYQHSVPSRPSRGTCDSGDGSVHCDWCKHAQEFLTEHAVNNSADGAESIRFVPNPDDHSLTVVYPSKPDGTFMSRSVARGHLSDPEKVDVVD